ncbi:MAG: hypothetical protein DDT33_00404 [Firmicutes bacterium]|nr:MAG: MoaD/ThiS family protein [Methanosarcinales archaeon Met12]MBT9131902.1 hypothetical protein [Bacillota bacterium]
MSKYKKKDAERKGAKKQREIEGKLMRENLEGSEGIKDHTKVTVILPGGATKRFDVSAKTRYDDMLLGFNLNPEIVVVLKNGVPVPLDDVVEAGELRVLKVVSGG